MEPRLKQFISLAIALVACAAFEHSILAQQSNQQARKVDEYSKCRLTSSSPCIGYEDEWARIDILGAELRNDLSLQGFIVGYKSRNAPPGSSLRHFNYVRNRLRSQIVDDSRVKVIDAGYRENLTIELWAAPNCAPLPVTGRPISIELPGDKSAYKFDEFRPLIIEKEVPIEFQEDEIERFSPSVLIDGFAALLESHPKLKGYIIAYDGEKDRAGTAYKFAEAYRAYIYNSAIIGNPPNSITSVPSRVVSLRGGRRKERAIELWVTPPDVPEPKPTGQIRRNKKR